MPSRYSADEILSPNLCKIDLIIQFTHYMVRQMEAGAWTEEQAEAFMKSLYDDDGPYLI